jgi:hypothetical protein
MSAQLLTALAVQKSLELALDFIKAFGKSQAEKRSMSAEELAFVEARRAAANEALDKAIAEAKAKQP